MKIIKTAASCILAAAAVCALNYLFSFFVATVLRLPLFVDTLFTCAIAFAVNPLAGIFIAILSYSFTNVFRYILLGVWGSYIFVPCIIAEILLIYGFRQKLAQWVRSDNQGEPYSFISTVSMLLLLYLLNCLSISLIGGIIDWSITITRGSVDNETLPYTFFKMGLLRNGLPLLAADILSRIPVNIVDRFITIFGGYGLGLLLRHVLEHRITTKL